MYIKPFDRNKAYKDFLGDKFLFPSNQAYASRLAFLEVCDMTNNLGDTGNPAEPANWTNRRFRAAADLYMTVTVQDGFFTDFSYEFRVRGGSEPTPLGALHGKVKGKITKVDATPEEITVEYILYGRPHEAAEIPIGVACGGARTSKWIWHYVRVVLTPIWCDDYSANASFISDSFFPSDDLYLNGALVDHRDQGSITNLWLALCNAHAPGMPSYVGSLGVCSGAGTPPLPNNPETAPANAYSQ